MDLEKELFAFERFRELYRTISAGEKSESPDFIVFNNGLKLGIELTELMDEEADNPPITTKGTHCLAKMKFEIIIDYKNKR